jgi:16S rRNA G966 N2-methylase RsmD
MRVISGKFRGRKLGSPADDRVRPTTDRIKETLFNILSSKNPDGYGLVLDLFGGSGSIGIESLVVARKKLFLLTVIQIA